MAKNQTKQNPIQEMRDNVLEVELRARYWKAQHDLRFYTLAAEKLQPDYDVWLQNQQTMQAELQKNFDDQMAKLQEAGAEVKEKELEVV